MSFDVSKGQIIISPFFFQRKMHRKPSTNLKIAIIPQRGAQERSLRFQIAPDIFRFVLFGFTSRIAVVVVAAAAMGRRIGGRRRLQRTGFGRQQWSAAAAAAASTVAGRVRTICGNVTKREIHISHGNMSVEW